MKVMKFCKTNRLRVENLLSKHRLKLFLFIFFFQNLIILCYLTKERTERTVSFDYASSILKIIVSKLGIEK